MMRIAQHFIPEKNVRKCNNSMKWALKAIFLTHYTINCLNVQTIITDIEAWGHFAECKESQIDIVCRICLMWMNLEIISSIQWASGQTRHKTRPWVTLNWNRCRLPSLASQELLWGPSNKLEFTSKLYSSRHHNILKSHKGFMSLLLFLVPAVPECGDQCGPGDSGASDHGLTPGWVITGPDNGWHVTRVTQGDTWDTLTG